MSVWVSQQFRQLILILGRPKVCVCVREDGCGATVAGRRRPEVCVCVREGFCALSIECSVMSGEWQGRVCGHFRETGEAGEAFSKMKKIYADWCVRSGQVTVSGETSLISFISFFNYKKKLNQIAAATSGDNDSDQF